MDTRILADLQAAYGMTVYSLSPVTGGLCNLKWKLATNRGDFLLKQYSPQRFDSKGLEVIEAGLHRQAYLVQLGVPCPALLMCDGRIIRHLDGQTAYLIMSFCPGRTQLPGAITLPQMHSLGCACARLHEAFARLPVPADTSFPASGGYGLDALWDAYQRRTAACGPQTPSAHRAALHAMDAILRQLDRGFFDRIPRGWAHEDFHPGNLLFATEGLSAIVDFDRNGYTYPWHDVGRALLSFAWDGQRLLPERVTAFVEGYAVHRALSQADVVDALRLTWCIEMPWWNQPTFFGPCDEVPRRFLQEMLWVTEHWDQLERLMASMG